MNLLPLSPSDASASLEIASIRACSCSCITRYKAQTYDAPQARIDNQKFDWLRANILTFSIFFTF